MRLLAKSEVAKAKSIDRQREIDEGLKLANRVDALRHTAAEEEAALNKFRINTIAKINEEIVTKAKEREELEVGNVFLREERIRLKGPIDLVQEWEMVRKDKAENEETSDYLLRKEIDLTEKENIVRDAQAGFSKREAKIKEKEEWAEKVVKEASVLHNEARIASSEAQNTLTKTNEEIEERCVALTQKEDEVAIKEADLLSREAQVKLDKAEIINEKKYIADRRKMLERGFAELRKKQNG